MEKKIISGQSFEGRLSLNEMVEGRSKAVRLYKEFLEALGYDVDNDPNMKGTPERVVKMYMDEVCIGTYSKQPKITTFENQEHYPGMVFQGDIQVKSLCSHHMCFIRGVCHIAYIPGEKVIGLSKLNRIVEWFSRRPQLQEQLTKQIHDFLSKCLEGNLGVAVMVSAGHTCVSHRGINQDSTMKTIQLSGAFLNPNDSSKEEFLHAIETL